MLNYLYRKTNNYKARYQEIEKFLAGVPEQLEIGCFGTSYARYDFDFTEYDIRGFNFGIYPQPLYYDLVLLRHYIGHFKKGAYILFIFPALVFAFDNFEKTDTRNYKYYKFLDKSEIAHYSWKTRIFEVQYPLFRHPEKIKKIWKDDARIYNQILWDTFENLYENSKAETAAEKRAAGWCREFGLSSLKDINVRDDIKAIFEKNRKRVEEMMGLCEDYGLKPVLLIPPVARCLLELFSEEFLNRYLFENIDRIDKKDAVVLNYLYEEEFQDYRLYSNADFMNRTGRKKFTGRVLRDLRMISDNHG